MPYVTERNLKAKTKSWLKAVAPYNTHSLKLEKKSAALLVIDMQKFFLGEEAPGFTEGGVAILSNVECLIAAFRKARRPVIFTTHVHKDKKMDGGILARWWKGMCMEGTPEADIHPRLGPPADREGGEEESLQRVLQHRPGDRPALPGRA